MPGVPRADDFGGPVPLRHGGGRRSALRNIGVIGEAVNHLPDDLARRHPEVDWAAIVGMRNASGRSMTHPVLPGHHSHELCQVLVASIRAS